MTNDMDYQMEHEGITWQGKQLRALIKKFEGYKQLRQHIQFSKDSFS